MGWDCEIFPNLVENDTKRLQDVIQLKKKRKRKN